MSTKTLGHSTACVCLVHPSRRHTKKQTIAARQRDEMECLTPHSQKSCPTVGLLCASFSVVVFFFPPRVRLCCAVVFILFLSETLCIDTHTRNRGRVPLGCAVCGPGNCVCRACLCLLARFSPSRSFCVLPNLAQLQQQVCPPFHAVATHIARPQS